MINAMKGLAIHCLEVGQLGIANPQLIILVPSVATVEKSPERGTNDGLLYA